MPDTLTICWSCRAAVDDLPPRVPRYASCPRCRAELHVCRQCRSFDPKMLGQCTHERADRVERKTQANFCSYFKLSANPPDHSDTASNHNVEDLNQLFGLAASENAPGVVNDSAAKAKAELNELFGLGNEQAEGESQ